MGGENLVKNHRKDFENKMSQNVSDMLGMNAAKKEWCNMLKFTFCEGFACSAGEAFIFDLYM